MSKLPAPSPVESTPDMPFAAPCRTLDMHAPLRWLILGWQDLARAPRISLTYGLALTLLSLLISVLTWRYGTMALYLGLIRGSKIRKPSRPVAKPSRTMTAMMPAHSSMGFLLCKTACMLVMTAVMESVRRSMIMGKEKALAANAKLANSIATTMLMPMKGSNC